MTNDTSSFSNVYMPLFIFFAGKHFCPLKNKTKNKAFVFLLLKYESSIRIWLEVFFELCNLQMLRLSFALQDLNSMFQEVFNFDEVQL